MRLEKMVLSLIKNQISSYFNEIEDGRGAIQDHVPTVFNGHVLARFGQGIIGPIFDIRPISREILSIDAEQIFRTGIEAPESIDIDPFPNGFISAADAEEQVGAIGIVIVISILARLWCD